MEKENSFVTQYPDLMQGKKIMYNHGFSSSAASGTVKLIRQTFPGAEVVAFDIPLHPEEGLELLRQKAEEEKPDLIIGTSMGGMYTELMKGYPRICVNPALHMAKLLTFNHLGKNVEFHNKRENGETSFKVDKQMVAQFKEIETKQSLKNITADEKMLVWGIFGKNDPLVNCQNDFTKAYGKDHFRIIEGEHSLTKDMLKKDVLPLIKTLLGL